MYICVKEEIFRSLSEIQKTLTVLNILPKYSVRGSLNKFPDFFFQMDTFIDSTHMKLLSPSK